MKIKIILGLILAAGISMLVYANTRNVTGPYTELANPVSELAGDKIVVTEIFWYGCPHCYQLEPYLKKWLAEKPDDVEFKLMPGILSKNWLAHARIYYTAEQMNVLDKIHHQLFDAIHKDRRKIDSDDALEDFVSEQGVDGDEFMKIFKSDAITEKLKQAFIVQQKLELTGVPTIIVDGKYMTSATQAGGNEGIINAINDLIAIERKTASN